MSLKVEGWASVIIYVIIITNAHASPSPGENTDGNKNGKEKRNFDEEKYGRESQVQWLANTKWSSYQWQITRQIGVNYHLNQHLPAPIPSDVKTVTEIDQNVPVMIVQKIVNERIDDGVKMYKCMYKGCDPSQPSKKHYYWHSLGTMEGSPSDKELLLTSFRAKKKSKKN